MEKISTFITTKTNIARSANIERDYADNQVLGHYIMTHSAKTIINTITQTLTHKKHSNKAFSLVGPYGSGKSSFALYLSNLLSHPNPLTLSKLDTNLAKSVKNHLNNSNYYCSVLLSGTPESLIKSFLKSLKNSIEPYYQEINIDGTNRCGQIDNLLTLDNIEISEVVRIIRAVRKDIAGANGKGILIIIDELGKFLEYAARHESDDIFLLQVLAEEAYKTSKANILLFVLLHQSIAYYGKNLGHTLKNEWTKIQGRYQPLSFVDTVADSLPIIAQVFAQNLPAVHTRNISKTISKITRQLYRLNMLPNTLNEKSANLLFMQCYPLHPLSAILLPILCQKIAQNERTLFNYLGGTEPYSLGEKIQVLAVENFIYPGDIFDYFMNGQTLANDAQTNRVISEAYSALERSSSLNQAQVSLLKTIALFNIANSHLKASKEVLTLCHGQYQKYLKKLLQKSLVTYRKFSQEYRVWQGSDFDLNQAIEEQLAQLATMDITKHINNDLTFLPLVAKKYAIEHHSLFYFVPVFINTCEYQKKSPKSDKPRIIFCLNNNRTERVLFSKVKQYFSQQDICVLLANSEQIKQTSRYKIALENIVKQNAIITQDPVIHREFNQYFMSAQYEQREQINQVLASPQKSIWSCCGKDKPVKNKRDIQKLLSATLASIYPQAIVVRNEIINRDNPSAQAKLGRKKLLLALLRNQHKQNLDIEGYPAEKSMYQAILERSGIHQKLNGKWQICPPNKDERYLEVWNKIQNFFDKAQEQAKNLAQLDSVLIAPPFGIKQPVLPIFYICVYLYHKDEVAIFEERFYVPYFTEDHLERFLKRQDTFTFQQFKIKGLNQALFNEYEKGLFSGQQANKNAQAIFKAIAKFITELTPYTKQTKNISTTAQKVRDAFKSNKSPQDLLFKKLPLACGFFGTKKNVSGFGFELKKALQEIKNAYPVMLAKNISILAEKLSLNSDEKDKVKTKLNQYGQSLKNYDLPNEVAEFINIIANDCNDNQRYFERIFTQLISTPPKDWNDNMVNSAQQKIMEYSRLIVSLYATRQYYHKDKLDYQEGIIKEEVQKVFADYNITEQQQYRIIVDMLKDKANNMTKNTNPTHIHEQKN